MLAKVSRIDITKFATAPTTQSTRNKILSLAQEIELRKTQKFISTGTISPYSDQEIKGLVLNNFVALAVKNPASIRPSMAQLVERSLDPLFWHRYK